MDFRAVYAFCRMDPEMIKLYNENIIQAETPDSDKKLKTIQRTKRMRSGF